MKIKDYITWQQVVLFQNALYEYLLKVESTGVKLFDEFVTERLMEDSAVEIHAPITKVNIPV